MNPVHSMFGIHAGRPRAVLGLALAVALGLPVRAQAVTVMLTPMKDNTLYEDDAGSLSNGAGSYFFVGKVDAAGDNKARRGLLAFDIASNIPAGATINSVTLRLNMSRTAAGAGSPAISMHRLTKDWGEGTSDAPVQEGGGANAAANDATWLHTFYNTGFWTNPGGDFNLTASAALVVSGVGAYTWSSTPQLVADVQLWLDTPATNFGWLMKGPETTPKTAKRFDAREHLSSGNRPLLTIDYTPFDTPTLKSSWGAIKNLYR